LIGQIDHVTFVLFREIGHVDPEPQLSIARRMALGLPRMKETSSVCVTDQQHPRC